MGIDYTPITLSRLRKLPALLILSDLRCIILKSRSFSSAVSCVLTFPALGLLSTIRCTILWLARTTEEADIRSFPSTRFRKVDLPALFVLRAVACTLLWPQVVVGQLCVVLQLPRRQRPASASPGTPPAAQSEPPCQCLAGLHGPPPLPYAGNPAVSVAEGALHGTEM